MDENKVEGSEIPNIELHVVESCKRFDSIGTKTRRSHNLSAKTYLKGIIVYITAPKVSLLGGFSIWYYFAIGLKVLVLDTNWSMFYWKPLKGKSLNLTEKKFYKKCKTDRGYFILNFESVCNGWSGIFLYSTSLCLNRPHLQFQSHGWIYVYHMDCLFLIFFQAW